MNILAIGPYERHNFGDILFFLVTKKYIEEQGHMVVPSSITYADMTKYFSQPVLPYDLLLKKYKWDAVWVVGGEIGGAGIEQAVPMALDSDESEIYKTADKEPKEILHKILNTPTKGLAYIPSLQSYDLNKNTKIIINSVGSLNAIKKLEDMEAQSVLSLLKSNCIHLSVRDVDSKNYLDENNIPNILAPDLVHALPKKINLNAKSRKIVFQISHEVSNGYNINHLARTLAKLSLELNKDIYLLVAGSAPGHDSIDYYRSLKAEILKINSSLNVDIINQKDALEIYSIVANSAIWIGSSLHGRIIAETNKVPRVSLDKYKVNNYCKKWDFSMPYAVTKDTLEDAITQAIKTKDKEAISGPALSDLSDDNMKDIISKLSAMEIKKSASDKVDVHCIADDILTNNKYVSKKFLDYAKFSKSEVRKLQNEYYDLAKDIEKLKQELVATQLSQTMAKNEARSIKKSLSYRLGRLILTPFRLSKVLFKRIVSFLRKNKNRALLFRQISNVYNIKINNYEILKNDNVALVIRSIDHPTSSAFIRLISPISYLAEKYEINLVDGEKPKIHKKTKIVIVQRTALAHIDDARELVDFVKSRGLRLYVDTDDAFGDLDKHHPQYEIQKERVEALDHIINNADEVWFSTEKLSMSYKCNKYKISYNTIDKNIWSKLKNKKIKPPTTSEPLRILYMGTITHSEDFNMIKPIFSKLHKTYKGKFQLHVIGVAKGINDEPWIVQHKPPDALYPNFVNWFSGLKQFDVGLSPLVDNNFNKSKSDIKCLDYLAIGVKPIVSDVEAYKNKELDNLIVRVKNGEDSWYNALEKEIVNITQNRKLMINNAQKGYDYLLSKRTSDKIAELLNKELTI